MFQDVSGNLLEIPLNLWKPPWKLLPELSFATFQFSSHLAVRFTAWAKPKFHDHRKIEINSDSLWIYPVKIVINSDYPPVIKHGNGRYTIQFGDFPIETHISNVDFQLPGLIIGM